MKPENKIRWQHFFYYDFFECTLKDTTSKNGDVACNGYQSESRILDFVPKTTFLTSYMNLPLVGYTHNYSLTSWSKYSISYHRIKWYTFSRFSHERFYIQKLIFRRCPPIQSWPYSILKKKMLKIAKSTSCIKFPMTLEWFKPWLKLLDDQQTRE